MKPGFVLIVADDLGYADLGCYGARAPTSPCLDRMAGQGLRFTDGYANSALCSPTRFALITGRYQYRLRGAAEEPLTGKARGDPMLGLPPEHPTFVSLLRDAGYATALVGKWHLGYPPHFGPLKSGYQEFFGPMGGGVDYFSHCDLGGRHDLFENEVEVQRSGYLTDLITDRAVDFIQRHAHAPFLLSVHYTAPHWPWETREDEAESKRIHGAIHHLDGGSVEIYQAMIRHMDEGIGRILQELERTGRADDTLVIFTSDNGGERFSDQWPLSGKKNDLLEGGIRVPLIARWPQKVPPGRVTGQAAISMDWAPTLLEAAGVAPHPDYPSDGVSLLGVLRESKIFERELFWRMKFRDQHAVRSGSWKYLSIEGNEFLYDLSRDARERANLSRREPGRLDSLRSRYAACAAQMPAIPDEAVAEKLYTAKDMAQPSV
ncbi:MAG: sulfatase-like hydrolase/transferase [Betaproteobacteria bacterium]